MAACTKFAEPDACGEGGAERDHLQRSHSWEDLSVRRFWWSLSRIPFCYVVFSLAVGLAESTSKQPYPTAASLASAA